MVTHDGQFFIDCNDWNLVLPNRWRIFLVDDVEGNFNSAPQTASILKMWENS